jgi:hypothetical protein
MVDGQAAGSYLRLTGVGAKSGLVRSLPNRIQVAGNHMLLYP